MTEIFEKQITTIISETAPHINPQAKPEGILRYILAHIKISDLNFPFDPYFLALHEVEIYRALAASPIPFVQSTAKLLADEYRQQILETASTSSAEKAQPSTLRGYVRHH